MDLSKQRKLDILASNLLYVDTVFGTIINYFIKEGFWKENATAPFIALIAVITAMLIILYHFIKIGQKWAKIMFVLFYGLSLIIGLRDVLLNGINWNFSSSLQAFNHVMQMVLPFVAFVLLLVSLLGFRRIKPRSL